ncbi:MAG: flagellar biosynthesis protein FlhF [Deltaproteobacteria bacterium]|nr:flagellar biosynthesis protein FlhF [Deltaproteobacteria bacterium]
MQVKVFESEDMASGLQKIKETLGPDALILSTRTVRKKGLGLLGKSYLEITAAKDSPELSVQKPPVPKKKKMPIPLEVCDNEPDTVVPEQEEIVGINPLAREIEQIKSQLAGQEIKSIQTELNELKELFREFSGKAVQMPQVVPPSMPATVKKAASSGFMISRLLEAGVQAEVAETIVSCARAKYSEAQLEDEKFFEAFLVETVADLISVSGPLTAQDNGPRKVALIGPTGVGKTTTMAKLAAEYLFRTKGSVALVTIDTYRIAAVEQLKVYGEIMNLPVEVVFSPEQLDQAFAKHKDKDLILIDTAGRSPKDVVKINELNTFLGAGSGVENHLVLAAQTREKDLLETIRTFGKMPLNNLIFTKLDECEDCGVLLNVPACQSLPVSFLTNGQRVPEDLLIAEPINITDFILGKM